LVAVGTAEDLTPPLGAAPLWVTALLVTAGAPVRAPLEVAAALPVTSVKLAVTVPLAAPLAVSIAVPIAVPIAVSVTVPLLFSPPAPCWATSASIASWNKRSPCWSATNGSLTFAGGAAGVIVASAAPEVELELPVTDSDTADTVDVAIAVAVPLATALVELPISISTDLPIRGGGMGDARTMTAEERRTVRVVKCILASVFWKGSDTGRLCVQRNKMKYNKEEEYEKSTVGLSRGKKKV